MRYGPWALVAGASEGLGRALAEQAAGRGLDLLLVARRSEPLAATAGELAARHRVEVDFLAADLATAAGAERVIAWVAGRPVGLLVANAACSPIGEFLARDLADHERVIELNCRTVTRLLHHCGRTMAERGRGGLLIVSSLASFQGGALVASYAASKAYLRVLGEGLWQELRPRGVDVLVSCPGIVDTPAYRATNPRPPGRLVPAPARPGDVARQTFDHLGRGPVVIPGRANRLAAFLTGRLLTRRRAIGLVSGGTARLYAPTGRAEPGKEGNRP